MHAHGDEEFRRVPVDACTLLLGWAQRIRTYSMSSSGMLCSACQFKSCGTRTKTLSESMKARCRDVRSSRCFLVIKRTAWIAPVVQQLATANLSATSGNPRGCSCAFGSELLCSSAPLMSSSSPRLPDKDAVSHLAQFHYLATIDPPLHNQVLPLFLASSTSAQSCFLGR